MSVLCRLGNKPSCPTHTNNHISHNFHSYPGPSAIAEPGLFLQPCQFEKGPTSLYGARADGSSVLNFSCIRSSAPRNSTATER